MSFTVVLGAFLLAAWVDARFEARRPATPGRRMAHVAASFVLLQLATLGAHFVVPEDAGVAPRMTAVFVLLLPLMVYALVSGLWIIRTFAESGFARR
jgi:hypothetical protein